MAFDKTICLVDHLALMNIKLGHAVREKEDK
jgi:hypothetical protein